jgi:hypothetical protein
MTDQELLNEIWRHIAKLNDDYTQMSVDVAILKAQMASICWWFRAIAGAFIVLLITQVWQILILRKNGNTKPKR